MAHHKVQLPHEQDLLAVRALKFNRIERTSSQPLLFNDDIHQEADLEIEPTFDSRQVKPLVMKRKRIKVGAIGKTFSRNKLGERAPK